MFALNSSSANVTAIASAASYLVMDIETGEAPETAILAALASWKAPSNMRDQAKIEDRKLEAMEKIRERSALLDAAPIVCVGIQTQHGAVVFNAMDSKEYAISGVRCVPCGNEKNMLTDLRRWLEIHTNESTILAGQNIKNFDLPKLRSAFVRHHLKLPTILAPRLGNEQTQSVVDTAYLFKAFSVEHRDDFCPSLDSVCNGLGIPKPKSVISGADVPMLVKARRYEEVLVYNAIDIAATARAYLLMSGQAEDLQ